MCLQCDYESLLRASRLDVTDNRRRVLEVVGNNSYPLSAADIFQKIQQRIIDSGRRLNHCADRIEHKYGIPMPELKRHMAEVAVKAHRHGKLNPKAHFQKEIDIDTVLNSMMVADPLQLFDCCPFTDGAAAVVVAEAVRTISRGPTS